MDFMALKKVVEHTFKEHTTPGEQVIASDFFHVIVLLVCSFSWLFGTFLLEPLTLTNLLTNIDLCPHSAALGKSGMYTDTILAESLMRHWWCFRNPVNSPVEVGSLSHYLQGFKNPRWTNPIRMQLHTSDNVRVCLIKETKVFRISHVVYYYIYCNILTMSSSATYIISLCVLNNSKIPNKVSSHVVLMIKWQCVYMHDQKKQYPALCSLSKVNIPVSPCECVCDISVCIELLLAKNYMDLYGIYKALDRYLCHSGFNMSILMVHLLVLTKRQDELNEIVDLAWLQSQHFTMTIYVSQSIVDTYTYTLTHTHIGYKLGCYALTATNSEFLCVRK